MQAIETAAPTGQGLTELEEAILLQAEMMDLKSSQTGAAEGTTVEARMTKGQGPVATVIVKRGSLKVGCLPSRTQNGINGRMYRQGANVVVAIVTSERGSWRLTQSPEDVAIDLSM